MGKYKCPCCGYFTFEEKSGRTYEICPVCFWEDDLRDYDDTEKYSESNRLTIGEARDNYEKFGACREADIPYVRAPERDEIFNEGKV